MTTPTIRTVTSASDLATVARLVAEAFDHLDANRYLVPDPAVRLSAMQAYFAMHTNHAAAGAGEVHLIGDHAAAVWFDRTTRHPDPGGYERVAEAAGPHLDRLVALDKVLVTFHPADPHWHLAFLAVDHRHRNRGLGTALLNHLHHRLDDQGLGAYLEATNADNRRGYRRHGYTVMDPSDIVVGDPGGAGTPDSPAGVTFTRMWRPARGS